MSSTNTTTDAEATEALVSMSRWVDDALSDRSAEAVMLHRVLKITEEAGEVAEALIGALGANPRKGVTGGMDKVLAELLDVACSALGAYEHIDGHRGRALDALRAKAVFVAERVGLSPRIYQYQTAVVEYPSLSGGFNSGKRIHATEDEARANARVWVEAQHRHYGGTDDLVILIQRRPVGGGGEWVTIDQLGDKTGSTDAAVER